MSDVLAPASPSPRFRRWFARHTRRMMDRAFAHVRLTREADVLFKSLDGHDGPLLFASNHASWWDPLIALRLAERYFPQRPLTGPVELEQFRRFGVLGKVGLFGLDPAHPAAQSAMVEHLARQVAEQPRALICITPHGAFADVRDPVRVRPGVAAVAAALPIVKVAVFCAEYAFWLDRRPEVFAHAAVCEPPEDQKTTAWVRTIRDRMQDTADVLASYVRARQAAPFVELRPSRGARCSINPAYDLWLRLRGVGTTIQPRRAETPREPMEHAT